MRVRKGLVGTAMAACTVACMLPAEAHAQDSRNRDAGWGLVSDVSLAVAGLSVAVTPRVYYSDPQSTVGWKGRWHVSSLAPLMTLGVVSLLVDQPIKQAFQDPRPGCSVDQTTAALPDSNCGSFGLPSTHAFATAGFAGMGLGVFLVDTFKYSNGNVHPGAVVGNVVLPMSALLLGSVARGVETTDNTLQPDRPTLGFEKPEQILAGAIPGLLIGAGLGAVYAVMQRPGCPYGDSLFCW